MDKIRIREFTVPAQVGILPWEKTCQQTVVVDITFCVDAAQIAKTDWLTNTTDYAALCDAIVSYLSAHRFNLLETLADQLAMYLIAQFSLRHLTLRVTKPKAIAHANGVSVTVERSCA